MTNAKQMCLCFRSCTMLAPSWHLCQRCVRLLCRRMAVITSPLNNSPAASQQPFDGHATSVRRICSNLSELLNLRNGQRFLQTTENRLGVGALRGLCDSSATQHQVIQHECEGPEARNMIPYKQAQTPSRMLPVTPLVGEYAKVHFLNFTFFF